MRLGKGLYHNNDARLANDFPNGKVYTFIPVTRKKFLNHLRNFPRHVAVPSAWRRTELNLGANVHRCPTLNIADIYQQLWRSWKTKPVKINKVNRRVHTRNWDNSGKADKFNWAELRTTTISDTTVMCYPRSLKLIDWLIWLINWLSDWLIY